MQVLVCLAEHAGEVVPKERLMQSVWPDTFVGDDVLTRCISELRRVFGDDVKEPRFIQTIPKSGYRLIAGVSSSAEHERPAATSRCQARDLPVRRTFASPLSARACSQAACSADGGSCWTRRAPGGSPRQPTLTQLTANPPDFPVTSARVSPDGKYLAYADPTGIQVRVIDTGETQRIADTLGMDVYAWSGDGTRIRAAACDTATCTGWDLSLVGGTRRRSGAGWPATDSVISTPDGSRLLRIAGSSRDLSVDRLDGSAPRHLVELGPNGSATWGADGERVLFTRGPSLIGGGVDTACRWFRVRGVQRPPRTADCRYRPAIAGWTPADGPERYRDQRSRRLGGSDRSRRGSRTRFAEALDRVEGGRLVHWHVSPSACAPDSGWSSASSDGKRVLLKSDTSHGDIYVARFDERHGRLLDVPRRLTTDERGSYPGAWTPDGQTILFNLGQSGSQDIYHAGAQRGVG